MSPPKSSNTFGKLTSIHMLDWNADLESKEIEHGKTEGNVMNVSMTYSI